MKDLEIDASVVGRQGLAQRSRCFFETQTETGNHHLLVQIVSVRSLSFTHTRTHTHTPSDLPDKELGIGKNRTPSGQDLWTTYIWLVPDYFPSVHRSTSWQHPFVLPRVTSDSCQKHTSTLFLTLFVKKRCSMLMVRSKARDKENTYRWVSV